MFTKRSVLIAAVLVAIHTSAWADDPPIFDIVWGANGAGNGFFASPDGIALGSGGEVYVADEGNNRVQKFTADGTFLLSWGVFGTDPGEFNGPKGIAVDASDNVYVAEVGGDRIQKFDSTGAFILEWGVFGAGNGDFNEPNDIDIGPGGNVYVADSSNFRIQVFTNTGAFVTTWGSFGTGNDQFSQLRAVEVDSSGNVYAIDLATLEVKKYTSTGVFQTRWGSSGSGNGQFTQPEGIAVDANDDVYVVDINTGQLQKFTPVGGFTWRISINFSTILGIAIDPTGNIYISDILTHVIQRYRPDLPIVEPPPVYLGAFSGFDPTGITTNSQNDVYISDASTMTVRRHDSDGVFISSLGTGSAGTAFGEFNSPTDLAVNALDELYVSDTNNARIQKFDDAGNFLLSWTSGFVNPIGIDIDSNGDVYVADSTNNRIQKFDANGNFILQWGSGGSGSGLFSRPWGLAIDAADNVYVADELSNNLIQKFDSSGNFLLQWGGNGSNRGEFSTVRGIAIDQNGDVLVGDGNNRIQKFDSLGNFLTIWDGTAASVPFSGPYYLAVGVQGKIYIGDDSVNRVTVYGTRSPAILSILDVGNDQGGQVRINFTSSGLDTENSWWSIDQYEAFRRIDPLAKAWAHAPRGTTASGSMISDAKILTEGWEFVGSTPAHTAEAYNLIAPTLADSTDTGVHNSVFFVRAATSWPGQFFDSAPDSGYSVDNLAPVAPQAFTVAYQAVGNDLNWDPPEDIDFESFRVYRGSTPGFVPGPGNLIEVLGINGYTDGVPDPWNHFYKISAVDFSGNESLIVSPEAVTGIDTPGLPVKYALAQNQPNPFNPSTVIPFALPQQSSVKLRIVNLAGRVVQTFSFNSLPAGMHSMVWNGKDRDGRRVASGVYLYRLDAGDFHAVKRMTLLK